MKSNLLDYRFLSSNIRDEVMQIIPKTTVLVECKLLEITKS